MYTVNTDSQKCRCLYIGLLFYYYDPLYLTVQQLTIN